MLSRNVFPVSIISTNALSSLTSTAVPTAVDMSPYFPVGRREVLFVVNIVGGTTSLCGGATVILEECASTATASFTSVFLAASTSTATWTTTANSLPLSTYAYGTLNYRYLRARYVATTVTGPDNVAISITALPIVRQG